MATLPERLGPVAGRLMALMGATGWVRNVPTLLMLLTLLTKLSPCTGERGGDWSWLLELGEHGSDLMLESELIPESV